MNAVYQHPQEEAALASLLQNDLIRALAGVYQQFYAVVNEFSEIRNRNFRVTNETHPRIHGLFQYARRRLGCKESVALYLEFDYDCSCRLVGSDGDAALVLSSKCLEEMEDAELLAMLGRQLAHVQCSHITYLGIDSLFELLLQRIPYVGSAAAEVAKGLLLTWRQYAEITADRGGTMVSGSADSVINAMLYQMGGRISRYQSDFLEGTKRICDIPLAEGRLSDTIMQQIVQIFPVPFGVKRMADLLAWSASDGCRKHLPHVFYNSSPAVAFQTAPDGDTLLQQALSCQKSEERLRLFHSAARSGNARAMAHLGQAYLKGSGGLPKDPNLGVRYIRQGADACNPDALYLLGTLYRTGLPGCLERNRQMSDWLLRTAYGVGQERAHCELQEKPIQVQWIPAERIARICGWSNDSPPPPVRARLLRWLWIPPQDVISAWEIASDDAHCPKAIAVCDTGIYLRDGEAGPRWLDWRSFFAGPVTIKVFTSSVALFCRGKEVWRGASENPAALVHGLIRLAKANRERQP